MGSRRRKRGGGRRWGGEGDREGERGGGDGEKGGDYEVEEEAEKQEMNTRRVKRGSEGQPEKEDAVSTSK
eukprot:768419-Hanusia_phi.AAC.3